MPASRILMIEPVAFCHNIETAESNLFQQNVIGNHQLSALNEFNNFVALLRENEVDVMAIPDSKSPLTPDSIFPNNWISFHEDNSICLFPMYAPNRRLERSTAMLEVLHRTCIIEKVHDFTRLEEQNIFLEGTGSMVLDRTNGIAYASTSVRTHLQAVEEFCSIRKFKSVIFNATAGNDQPIYHTNVMMCLAEQFVVICLDAVNSENEKKTLVSSFNNTKKEIITITSGQMHHFAGNMLQLKNKKDELLLVMSTQAFESLTNMQITKLETYNRIIHSSLQTIETCGGGSARCMIAEIFNVCR